MEDKLLSYVKSLGILCGTIKRTIVSSYSCVSLTSLYLIAVNISRYFSECGITAEDNSRQIGLV